MVPPEAEPTARIDLPHPGEADERRLPNYEDLSQAPAVTQVDDDIQSRLQAMTRGSMADSTRPALPNLPPPPPSRPPPPNLPPPPRPSAPPPPPSDAPLPRFDAASSPGVGEPLPDYTEPTTETTEINFRGPVLPPSDPPDLTAPDMSAPSMFGGAPSLLVALKLRVRFAGGEVPLWSLLTPMVLLLVLGSAFVAAAISGPEETGANVATGQTPDAEASAALAAAPSSATTEPTAAALPAPLPANAADEALEALRAEELTKDEALRLAAARRQRETARIAQLRQKLARDPGLFKDAATLSELRRAAEDPLTAPDALSAMAEAPGPLSADLLYEMWTGTVARNGATELARSLVFSKEVRAKASPELAIALELRIAETCEQNRALLPKVTDKGDRRSLALLAKLSRRYGCGANKRQDCYPCLREDKAVDDAMTAVKKRREPKPFLGK
jgi:hypothetical protein